jgi:RimJ/RimL family protein N-acetyltransferase
LREYRLSDFEAYAAHAVALGVVDKRRARGMFGSNVGEWLLQGAGWWAIELRDSGTLVGNVGAFFRETWPEIEIGWNIFQAYQGQKIATEAATAVVRYAFDVRRERRVTALIDASNTASLRVAAHLEMTYEADTDLYGSPVGRYVRAVG